MSIEAIDLSVPTRIEAAAEPVRLRTPRAGWSDFAVRVKSSNGSARSILRLPTFARGPLVSAANAYQVISTPVDLSAAAYVRQSGEPGKVRPVPRVLRPLPVGRDGSIALPASRDPILVWIELLTAPLAAVGDVAGVCEASDAPGAAATGSVRLTLSVADLTLPPERHLRIAAPLEWSAVASSPSFAGITPRLLSRRDPTNAAAVAELDGYLRLAHDHRTDLYVTRLQPIVKWPADRPPAIDWADFDALTQPWFDGSAFADHQPTGFWPLPGPDALDRFDLAARAQYWALVASHFQRRPWVSADHPVVLRSETGAAPNEADRLILSAEARALLDASPAVTALLPVRADRLPLADASNASLVPAASGGRLLTRAVGSVRWGETAPWPANVVPPSTYLNGNDVSAGDAVLHGTGDEEDVRSAAWLAFLRDSTLLTCGRPLPSTSSPDVPVPGDELPWFYPGRWYGVDGPLPTLQLKWLRQAEQDYEVLKLTADGGDRGTALAVSRLIAKPVDAATARTADGVAPTEVTLLGGSIDPHACSSTRDLLIDRIVSRQSQAHGGTGLTQLDLTTVRWFNAHQRPTAFATAVDWTWSDSTPDLMGQTSDPMATGPGRWIMARVKVDVYDPAEPVTDAAAPDAARAATWSGNTLQWQTNGGWEPRPPTTYVPVIPACGVRPLTALARFNLEQATPAPAITASGDAEPRPPITLSLVDPADRQTIECPLVLPVATSDRLTRPVTLDGMLDDWVPTDAALLDRPLVRMSSRPSVHAGEARSADHPSSLYTGWTDDDLYVAFRVGGATANVATRNFVEYRDGRAWGEDLCEVTAQPVYADDALGSTLHVVCKVGGVWIERQRADGTGGWQPFEGTPLRYAATVDPTTGTWRGEMAIPWRSLVNGRGRPSLLRFNFAQHVHATGESATWAGPVDQSRQTAMAGLLVLRDPQARAEAGR